MILPLWVDNVHLDDMLKYLKPVDFLLSDAGPLSELEIEFNIQAVCRCVLDFTFYWASSCFPYHVQGFFLGSQGQKSLVSPLHTCCTCTNLNSGDMQMSRLTKPVSLFRVSWLTLNQSARILLTNKDHKIKLWCFPSSIHLSPSPPLFPILRTVKFSLRYS